MPIHDRCEPQCATRDANLASLMKLTSPRVVNSWHPYTLCRKPKILDNGRIISCKTFHGLLSRQCYVFLPGQWIHFSLKKGEG
ncbi:hypothetical protein PUN28_009794 [Cardiocondyla obscurior]|uniref:Ribosomal protein S19 n=1 Tax=Cardiocondyla obscurior TaxID=286306 RepID=A0AAW2FQK8_9HYME